MALPFLILFCLSDCKPLPERSAFSGFCALFGSRWGKEKRWTFPICIDQCRIINRWAHLSKICAHLSIKCT